MFLRKIYSKWNVFHSKQEIDKIIVFVFSPVHCSFSIILPLCSAKKKRYKIKSWHSRYYEDFSNIIPMSFLWPKYLKCFFGTTMLMWLRPGPGSVCSEVKSPPGVCFATVFFFVFVALVTVLSNKIWLCNQILLLLSVFMELLFQVVWIPPHNWLSGVIVADGGGGRVKGDWRHLICCMLLVISKLKSLCCNATPIFYHWKSILFQNVLHVNLNRLVWLY